MPNQLLLILGAILPIFWGTAYIFPTKGVVKDFGAISDDNKNILTMEWLNETIALYLIGFLVIVTTLMYPYCQATPFVHIAAAMTLIAMAILSLATGAKAELIFYKLCPVFFGSAAILILLGTIL